MSLGDQKVNALLWADDLLILSKTSSGLQKAIYRTNSFYSELGLDMNKKKTKVMIFNLRGIKITDQIYTVGGFPIEIVDTYQYLGIKLRPSGSLQLAASELHDKATRAWFAISNVIY